jgi:predicted nucleic-acid-binding Zn-ribbon protein
MKASKQCPKCSSRRVGYLENVLDLNQAYPEAYSPAVVALDVARGRDGVHEARGKLEAYLCADCGFYETYVKDPASVPFEDLAGFHWLNETPGTGQPYR